MGIFGRFAFGTVGNNITFNVPAPFHLPSFAKINWSLRILGRRADGYHEIQTVMQTISPHDSLEFSARDDDQIVVSCNDDRVPKNADNLIVKAALALRKVSGTRGGAGIHLEKVIPMQAGLGGASSNAAIALLGLARLWGLKIAFSELLDLAAGLGSDVPFFLFGGTALATGKGIDISPLVDRATTHLLIIKPKASISTTAAYGLLNAPALTTPEGVSILSVSSEGPIKSSSELIALKNDFEPVIFAAEPEIGRAKQALIENGAIGALLAGSGSCVFGIFDNTHAQQSAFEQMRAIPEWQLLNAVTLSREDYLQALGSCGGTLLRSVDLGSNTGA